MNKIVENSTLINPEPFQLGLAALHTYISFFLMSPPHII